jgi:hypothetical protein
VLVLAPAAANGETAAERLREESRAATAATRSTTSLTLTQRLARVTRTERLCRNTIRFYETHRWYLRSEKYGPRARARLHAARVQLASLLRSERSLSRAVARQETRLLARRLASAPPRVAICHVFGRRYCRQAVAVSWCESRLSTRAQNGQYLGLFQMGYSERQRFGHGPTAHAQARAAHRYFELTGRDWSPWSCKPWYAT